MSKYRYNGARTPAVGPHVKKMQPCMARSEESDSFDSLLPTNDASLVILSHAARFAWNQQLDGTASLKGRGFRTTNNIC